ncbi:unnamed protein product [Thelazia callipaeda]|uniref:Fcf2 domain-containing protein n=1 Tax=Thelazia callipaeda TaxID=103827 RepID=A0A0N5D1F6_THECL|nr:unnamed protein product [Thelazia callipaeda]
MLPSVVCVVDCNYTIISRTWVSFGFGATGAVFNEQAVLAEHFMMSTRQKLSLSEEQASGIDVQWGYSNKEQNLSKEVGPDYFLAPKIDVLDCGITNLFVLDKKGKDSTELRELSISKERGKRFKKIPDVTLWVDETTKKSFQLLSRSIIKPDFETNLSNACNSKSWRALKRQRKATRESTKGDAWYNLPAAEMTEERKRDLEIIQMRNSFDTRAHYKKNDLSALPKYFQVGTVIETKADFYSSRIPKRNRKQTIVEELLEDMDFETRQRRKYQEIKSREAITKRGAFRNLSFLKKKKKFREKV